MPENGRGERVAAGDERVDLDCFTALDSFDQAEIGRREETDVVGVLPVDALETLGDHKSHAAARSATTLCSRDEPLP
jgi:hypothetical protein